jgi:hypothetical protein
MKSQIFGTGSEGPTLFYGENVPTRFHLDNYEEGKRPLHFVESYPEGFSYVEEHCAACGNNYYVFPTDIKCKCPRCLHTLRKKQIVFLSRVPFEQEHIFGELSRFRRINGETLV